MVLRVGGISLGELAEVGGVVVAILAIVLGPLMFRVRSHRAKLVELEARIARAERVGELVCTSVTRGLAGIDNTLDWSAGILHRLLLGRESEIDAADAIQEMRALRVTVERATTEVRLLAGARGEQVSALQQLTYRLGDSGTLITLSEVASLGGLPGLSRTSLQQAHHQLAQRLVPSGVGP